MNTQDQLADTLMQDAQAPAARPGRFRRYAVPVLKGMLLLFVLGALASAIAAQYAWKTWIVNGHLPDVNTFGSGKPNVTTRILDRNGILLGEIFVERRTILDHDDIAPLLVHAVLAAEDAHFLEHKGLDYRAIVTAAIQNAREDRRSRGASTITQQVVKMYVGKERTIKRKAQEAYLAIQLEKRWSKDEILTFYLNQIYFGHRRYGIEAAAQYYFGKHAHDATAGEAALLASLPKAPEHYPHDLPAWKERQKYVLGQMVRYGWTTQAEADKAIAMPIVIVGDPANSGLAPEFVDEVEHELKEKFGDDLGHLGYTITTTCDATLEIASRGFLEMGLRDIDKKNGDKQRPQGALIVMDPHSREVLAMVGGYEQKRGNFNRALFAKRQPGSTFKSFVWAAAFNAVRDDFITPTTQFLDEEKTYEIPGSKPWTPKNHTPSTDELVTMRYALAHSMNTISAQVTEKIGPDAVVAMAKTMGIKSPLMRPLGDKGALIAPMSIALGTSEVTPIELTNAYAVFADQGKLAEPQFILKMDGAMPPRKAAEQVITPALAFQMTSVLKGVIREGTAVRARKGLDRPAAGKTGTSQLATDAWFVGYTSDIIAGVWVGNDDSESLGSYWEGSRAALPIWTSVIQAFDRTHPVKDFGTPPPGTVMVKNEVYLEGKIPDEIAETDPATGEPSEAVPADGGTAVAHAPAETAQPKEEAKTKGTGTDDAEETDDTSASASDTEEP